MKIVSYKQWKAILDENNIKYDVDFSVDKVAIIADTDNIWSDIYSSLKGHKGRVHMNYINVNYYPHTLNFVLFESNMDAAMFKLMWTR